MFFLLRNNKSIKIREDEIRNVILEIYSIYSEE